MINFLAGGGAGQMVAEADAGPRTTVAEQRTDHALPLCRATGADHNAKAPNPGGTHRSVHGCSRDLQGPGSVGAATLDPGAKGRGDPLSSLFCLFQLHQSVVERVFMQYLVNEAPGVERIIRQMNEAAKLLTQALERCEANANAANKKALSEANHDFDIIILEVIVAFCSFRCRVINLCRISGPQPPNRIPGATASIRGGHAGVCGRPPGTLHESEHFGHVDTATPGEGHHQ